MSDGFLVGIPQIITGVAKSDLTDTLHKFYNNNLTAIKEAGGI